jgi:hypothetical protein
MKALRLCIERLIPMSHERPLPVRIPAAQDAPQITIALQAVFDGLGAGQLTPGEAQKLAGLLETQRKAIEIAGLEDHAERALVRRIADSAWRLRRFPAAEAALYSAELLSEQAMLTRRESRALLMHRLEASPNEAKDPELYRQLQARELEIREELNSRRYAIGRAFRRDSRNAGGFTRLSRCEMLLERGFYRCLNEFQRLKSNRSTTSTKRQNEPTTV